MAVDRQIKKIKIFVTLLSRHTRMKKNEKNDINFTILTFYRPKKYKNTKVTLFINNQVKNFKFFIQRFP
jgi:hypothetical protein